jgi:hypothetical protein
MVFGRWSMWHILAGFLLTFAIPDAARAAGAAQEADTSHFHVSADFLSHPFIKQGAVIWYVGADRRLHGKAIVPPSLSHHDTSELFREQVSNDYAALPDLDPAAYSQANSSFTNIRQIIQRDWHSDIHGQVMDTLRTNEATLAIAADYVARAWGRQIGSLIAADQKTQASHADLIMEIAGAITGELFETPVIAVPMGLMIKDAVSSIVQDADTDFSGISAKMSTYFHDAGIAAESAEVQSVTNKITDLLALIYTTDAEGYALFADQTADQSRRQSIGQLVPRPELLETMQQKLASSRDARLLFAVKIAAMLPAAYSDQLNNFIVTGYFSEMKVADTGDPARRIRDIYIPPAGSGLVAESEPDPLHRRFRYWSIQNGELTNSDMGSFHGAIGEPYWDAAVQPVIAGPELHGGIGQVVEDLAHFQARQAAMPRLRGDVSRFTSGGYRHGL